VLFLPFFGKYVNSLPGEAKKWDMGENGSARRTASQPLGKLVCQLGTSAAIATMLPTLPTQLPTPPTTLQQPETDLEGDNEIQGFWAHRRECILTLVLQTPTAACTGHLKARLRHICPHSSTRHLTG